jgi:D-glycero-D-manno-heptose 1,7-bisphosphate phosphatase
MESTAMSIDIFLDRDGTLIEDTGYISKIEDIKMMNGVIDGLKLFMENGYRLHLVSNQSGIVRGKCTPREFAEVQSELVRRLALEGIHFTSVNFCFHAPEDRCECRKPEIGMFEMVSKKFKVFHRSAAMIGDSEVDEKAASNFKIAFWRVGAGYLDFLIAAREVIKSIEK